MTTDEGRSEGEDMSEPFVTVLREIRDNPNSFSLYVIASWCDKAADLLEANAAEIAELRAENEQHMDIRSDMDCLLAWIASTLGVESEPHQTWQERLMERVGKLALAAVEQSEAGDKTHVRTYDRRNVVCHAEGDTCLGCDHYYGKADICEYAPIQSKGSPDAWL